MARKVKKRKIKLKKLFLFLIFIGVLFLLLKFLFALKIKNITVSGNTIYSDWEIIEKASLSSYPSSLENLSLNIEKKLEEDPFIKKASVSKSFLTDVSIKVEENLPLFYYLPSGKTILKDGSEVSSDFPVPTVINYVPDKIYSSLISKMGSSDYSILKRISEIKYDPNDVDDERFFLSMNDGNDVYLTLEKFGKIDNYLSIIKEFDNKKGTLYLDSGEYFEIRVS